MEEKNLAGWKLATLAQAVLIQRDLSVYLDHVIAGDVNGSWAALNDALATVREAIDLFTELGANIAASAVESPAAVVLGVVEENETVAEEEADLADADEPLAGLEDLDG